MKKDIVKKDFYNFTRTDTKIIKGFAILFMVIDHLFAWPNRIKNVNYISLFSLDGIPIEQVLGIMGKICVALFVILSGYGTYEQFKNKKEIKNGVFKKILGLYVKYWQIFLISVPFFFLFNVSRVEKSLSAFLLNFFAIDITYNGEWWFITPFIVLMLIFPLVLKWENSKHSNFKIDIFIVLAFFVFDSYIYPELMTLNIFKEFALTNFENIIFDTLKLFHSFLIGVVMAKYDLIGKFLNFFKNKALMFSFSLLLCALALVGKWKFDFNFDIFYAAAFIFGCVGVFKSVPCKPVSKLFVWLGKHSTNIWLIHSSLCYLLAQKLIFAPKISVLIVIWLIVLSAAIGFAIEKLFGFLGFLYKKATKSAVVEK